MSKRTKNDVDSNVVVATMPNVVERRDENNAKNVVDTTKKTFRLSTLARELGHNEKQIRARFRRFASHDDEKFNCVETLRLKNAKTRWIYPIDALATIRELCKRDDDE